MDKPLQLLQRPQEPRWTDVVLTDLGRALATGDDPAEVLEESLGSIRFASEPWTPRGRVGEYRDFDLGLYDAAIRVVGTCDGFIDRDEFDFFLSRIRRADEVPWAIEGIRSFRDLSADERRSLHPEVSRRIPGAKRYQNWRDVALHTFSLFSLGTSLVRDGQRLLLTDTWVEERSEARAGRTRETLRIPELEPDPSLQTPPAAPAINAGADGESFVAKVLRSQGWEVVFYTNRRGYGFDLWARRGDSAIVIEVKSSLGTLGAVELTANEWAAAQQYGRHFFLALVEGLDGDGAPNLRMVQDPVAGCAVEQRTTTSYTIARTEWVRAAIAVDQ